MDDNDIFRVRITMSRQLRNRIYRAAARDNTTPERWVNRMLLRALNESELNAMGRP